MEDYLASVLAADEAAGAVRAERDALRARLALFHERSSMLPEEFQEMMFTQEPVDAEAVRKIMSPPRAAEPEEEGVALVSPNAQVLGQMAARSGEDLATAHIGNIAALADLGLRKAGNWFFGGETSDGEDEDAGPGSARGGAAAAAKQ